jgi:uncharacterized membrane protein YtjA (UPF0391 family)
MKQAQSRSTPYRSISRTWTGQPGTANSLRWVNKPVTAHALEIKPPSSLSVGQVVMTLVTAVWFTVTLPFRLIFWIIAWMGRLTAVVLGFSLMVVGIALWAGPLFFIGIPLFVVGLVLTLRCLD